jgi:hypothetical protein
MSVESFIQRIHRHAFYKKIPSNYEQPQNIVPNCKKDLAPGFRESTFVYWFEHRAIVRPSINAPTSSGFTRGPLGAIMGHAQLTRRSSKAAVVEPSTISGFNVA